MADTEDLSVGLDALRAIWALSSVAVVVVDRDLRIRASNDGYARLTGTPMQEALGLLVGDVSPNARGLVPLAERVMATGEPVRGLYAPFDWGDLTIDIVPLRSGSAITGVVIVGTGVNGDSMNTQNGAVATRRLYFELSPRLARTSAAESKEAIHEALGSVADVFGLSRAYVRVRSDDGSAFVVAHEYHRPDLGPVAMRAVPFNTWAWAYDEFRAGKPVILASLADVPESAKEFRASLEAMGLTSTVGVPVLDGTELLGYVVYTRDRPGAWSAPHVGALRLLGDMLAGVIVRCRAEDDFRDRLRFEEVISTVSARFVDIAPEDVDREIQGALVAIGQQCELDRAILVQLDSAGEVLSRTHEWCAPSVPSIGDVFTSRRVKDAPLLARVLAGGTLTASEETAVEGSDIERLRVAMGAHAFAIVPLVVEGTVRGLLASQVLGHRRREPAAFVGRVRLLADVLASALARRESMLRLQRSERKFRRILGAAMDGFFVMDTNGTLLEWTAQCEAVFGWEREDVVGRHVTTAIDPGDHATLDGEIARASADAASPAARFELRGRRRDGRIVPVELSISRLDQEDGVVLAAFARDITHRKRQEAERERAFDQVSLEKRSVEGERDYLREERDAERAKPLTWSPSMRAVLDLVEAVAETTATVLLLGESGVGKEVLARAIHDRSTRARGAFIKVNCAAVPESLFESEFFGHVKGSFTGAHRDRVGRFELADKGTLFLDEVGEVPLVLQPKLLRVLQEGVLERVGDERSRKVDVRILAATNRDLEQEILNGRFRADLYYRLSVFPVRIPPLRERGADIVGLARYFLATSALRARKPSLTLSLEDEALLQAYEWPGNIRELEHVIERAVILSKTTLRLDLALPSTTPSTPPKHAPTSDVLREDELRRMERENLLLALKTAGGRVAGPDGAAALLGVRPSTLRDRIKAFGVGKE